MTKSKNHMITKSITHLATDTFPEIVIMEILHFTFSLLALGRYLFP